MQPVFINTLQGMETLVDLIYFHHSRVEALQSPLYIDIEGERLSRDGKVSLLTVLVRPGQGRECSYIIDIHTLGNLAFSTVGNCGHGLKAILESPEIIKVFFDVRNDSDALYAHYGIKLQGVRDVQLMESACRPTTESRSHICGLSKCIEGVVTGREGYQWRLCKDNGERLWNPQKGGTYSVFNIRPPPNEIIAYCVGDVKYLPVLYRKFRLGTDRWSNLVAEKSQNRVTESQKPEYRPHGEGRTLNPWSPEQNKLLDSWTEVNPRKDRSKSVPDWIESEDFWDEWLNPEWLDDSWDGRQDLEEDNANDYEDWTKAAWQLEGPPS